MRQKELLDSIKKHLSRFEVQVKISSANNEYDINIHSENVIIPILNLVFGIKLINANYVESKNAEAIDLIDASSGIAFQVTSTKSIEKIKNTISKFVNSKYRNRIETLYIYILSEKQANYTQSILDKAADKRLKFSAKDNIIDSSDLYRKLNELNDLDIISKVEEILRNQFSDIYLYKTFTLQQFESFKSCYTQSCVANFSRINFFGLSVNTNKPREIELYLLFVKPIFSLNSADFGYFFQRGNKMLFEENLFFKSVSGSLETSPIITFSELRDNDLSQVKVSKLFSDSILRLEDSNTLSKFEIFHEELQKRIEIHFSDLFASRNNIVVIGKPGAGKSSFIKYSICKILEKDFSVFSNKEIYEYVPFRIELHKYNKYKKTKSGGLIDYLNDLLKTEYQQILDCEIINSILKTFATLFFFDGLDEIFDIQERLDVRNDIEAFIGNYNKVKAVVTSRYESYEEVSLSEKLFTKFELLDFNEDQVYEYVNRWYAIEESSVDIREKESHNCLLQLRAVESELKHNPLLLSLILLLYRNELDIPTSKLSIYESCTNTIVETRDVKEKKLDFNLKIVNKLSVFTALAYWQFQNESQSKGGHTFETVRAYIVKYLIEKGEFTNLDIAQQATDEFLEFAKVRSIYFENKFTHKTFLEYFTAYYIYSIYFGNWRKADEFSELMTSYIGLSAWSVVLELLICKIDSTQINYVIIDELAEKLYERNRIDTLIFLLQIIKYLKNISPRMIKTIIYNSIEFCFKDGERTKELKIDYQEALFSHLANLGSSERFKDIIELAFLDIIRKNTISNLYINAFAYEFAIVSGNTSLVKVIKENNLDSNSEYIFILKLYPNLFEKDKYIDSLKLFISTFGDESTVKVFRSPFKQKIYFASSDFNWNITFFMNHLSVEKPYDLFQQLINAGISKKALVESAGKISAKASIEELKRKLNIIYEKDSNYRRFIRNVLSTYSSHTPESIPDLHYKNAKFFDNQNKIRNSKR